MKEQRALSYQLLSALASELVSALVVALQRCLYPPHKQDDSIIRLNEFFKVLSIMPNVKKFRKEVGGLFVSRKVDILSS